MKKVIFLTAYAIITTASTVFGQCSSLFSFAANFETVNFFNQSAVSNAHYFWNFGDGTGANYKDPIHKFPESGNYQVTLFAHDTVSNCSSYYEYWVNVTKFSTDSCQPGAITDSLFSNRSDDYLKVINNPVNCNAYNIRVDGGPAQNFGPNNWIWLSGGWQHAKFLSRVKYYTYDTINGVVNHREIYRTVPYRYTSAKNHDDCSANFEFSVVSQNTSGQRILLKAMNKTAASYSWEIMGFGNPISSGYDTISKFYPYNYNNFWFVGLHTIGSTGCKDTLYQTILIQDITRTITGVKEYGMNESFLSIYPNPVQDKITISNTVEMEKITVLDALGQELFILNNPKLSQEIDVSHLPTGIYFIRAISKQGQSTGKIIKE